MPLTRGLFSQNAGNRFGYHARAFRREQLTLPDDEDSPAHLLQGLLDFTVSFDVLGKFVRPELCSCGRKSGPTTPCMAMPETTVHKYDAAASRENDIGSPREIATMKPKA